MVEGEVSSAAAANGMSDHPEDSEAQESQPVAERDPSERYSRFDIVLGRGAFKTVYKGFDEEEGIEVAWNQVRVNELVTSREERDRLFAEIRVLKQLKHKNIMTFYDSWLDQKTYSVNFITEMFTSGTLRQYRKRHKHIDPEVLKGWAWQILCGLVYLHGHTPPIIHRDLKCDNIFINGSEGVVKIGDLGLATLLRGRTAPQSVLGTPEFMAPELYDEEYDDRVDVYSYGMCLLELATLQYPYCECRNAAQIYRKVTLGVRPAGLQKVPTVELAEFINVCIGSRDSRPRARQLLKHPYFDTIRQEKCAQYKLSAENGLVSTGSGIPFSGMSDSGVPTEFFSDCASQSGSVSRTSSEVTGLPPVSLPFDPMHDPMHTDTSPSALTDPNSSKESHVSMRPSFDEPVPVHVGAPQHAITRPPSLMGGSSGDLYSPRSEPPHTADHRTPPLSPAVSIQGDSDADTAATAPEVLQASAPPSADVDANSISIEQAASYATVAESLVTMAEVLSDGELSGFGDTATVVTAGGNRQFKVKGQLSNKAEGDDDEKLNLRLRICQPLGPARTVEFDFDMRADTAMSVASEMVEDLSLSHDDARAIAAAIKQEVKQLTGQAPMFSIVDRSSIPVEPTPEAASQVSATSSSQQEGPGPQPISNSQKDDIVQQQTAELPADMAQQPNAQGQEGPPRANSPAPAFDAAAYASAAAVRTNSPGARPHLLPARKSDSWEHPRPYLRPPLSSLRPTPINQQGPHSNPQSVPQPEASSSFDQWLSHEPVPGLPLQPTRSDAGSYMASHLQHSAGSDDGAHMHPDLSSPHSQSSQGSRSSMASVATAPPSLPSLTSIQRVGSGQLSEQMRQQVQWGKRGLSPPREEDRKLPLQKLFDNLHEFEQTVPAAMELAPLVTGGDMTIKTQIPAGLASPFRSSHSSPLVFSSSPFSQQHHQHSPSQQQRPFAGSHDEPLVIPPRPTSSCSDRAWPSHTNGRHPLLQTADSRRITADQLLDRDRHIIDRSRPGSGSQFLAARAIAPEEAILGPSASAPHSKVSSRDSSPLRDVHGLVPLSIDPSSAAPLIGPPLGRTKSGTVKPPVDLHREKELRRKQAADAMKNMEFKSLEGLDSFGLSRGCKTSLQSLAGLGSKFRPSPFPGNGAK